VDALDSSDDVGAANSFSRETHEIELLEQRAFDDDSDMIEISSDNK